MKTETNPDQVRVYKVMIQECGRWVSISHTYSNWKAAFGWLPLWKIRAGNRPVFVRTELRSVSDGKLLDFLETMFIL